jgi:predicted transcriptional regulator YdeE
MQPKIVTKPAFIVAGMLYRGRNEKGEIPQLWQAFGPRMGELVHAAGEPIAYGVMDHFDEVSGEFDYLAGIKVGEGGDLPDGMVSWQIPAQTYAVVSTTLPTIRDVFDELYNAWLPASGYRRAPGPEFELYDERFNAAEPHSELDLYIPIE